MKPSALQPPTFAEDYITTILSPDALAWLTEFRKEMKTIEKISKVPSMIHLLVPTS